MKRTYITDDLGYRWYYTGQRIKCASDDSGADGGYFCDSLEDGFRLLVEYGYISNPEPPIVYYGELDLKAMRADN